VWVKRGTAHDAERARFGGIRGSSGFGLGSFQVRLLAKSGVFVGKSRFVLKLAIERVALPASAGPECGFTPGEGLAALGVLCDIQLSNNVGRRTPTRVADGHADSQDKSGMGSCRSTCKLLKMQSKIVVIVKFGVGLGVVFNAEHCSQSVGLLHSERERTVKAGGFFGLDSGLIVG
jgi:hypothetical protein